MANKSYVCVIGAANVDICGYPFSPLVPKTSNIGKVSVSIGGVGRNIAENLSRLGIRTKLITAIGSDGYGRMIREHCNRSGIDTSEFVVAEGENSSSYMAVLDSNNDMSIAIADTHILDKITLDIAQEKLDIIRSSSACVIDANCSRELIKYLTEQSPETDFFLDTVSKEKAKKAIGFLGNFHTIKPNIYETEVLTGMTVSTREDIIKASEKCLLQGVKRVFISLGKEGVFYNDSKVKGFLKVKNVKVVNATGAGDAFVAGLVYGHLNKLKLEDTVRHSLAASYLALSCKEAVNSNMNINFLKQTMKEIEYV